MNSTTIRRALFCITIWHVTAVVVFAGFVFGQDFLAGRTHPNRLPAIEWEPFANWDGYWYTQIVEHGYFWDPTRHSSVAFFPGYLSLAVLLRSLIPISAIAILALISNLSLLATVWSADSGEESSLCDVSNPAVTTLLALCLWPMGLFLRVAYSEAFFLLLIVTILRLLRLRASPLLVALIAGLATGTRSVGVALLLPLAWDWWQRSSSIRGFAARAIVLGSISCWGLVAYMVYQHLVFGDAFAFVQTQQHWGMRPDLPWKSKLVSLVTLEPILSIYVPGSSAYWAQHEYVRNPLFSLQFWNPIYFVTCAGLVAYGAWKKWLTTPEWLLSIGLLGIPYVMQSYRMMMTGHGRFTCVVFPMYIVLGRLMAKWPAPVMAIVCTLMGIQLFYWSALFAAWHRVF